MLVVAQQLAQEKEEVAQQGRVVALEEALQLDHHGHDRLDRRLARHLVRVRVRVRARVRVRVRARVRVRFRFRVRVMPSASSRGPGSPAGSSTLLGSTRRYLRSG